MKQTLLIVLVLLFVFACTTQKGIVRLNNTSADIAAEDSVEYELETFDARFETWYEMNRSPAMERSQSYYENWNRQYVAAWNSKASDIRRASFFEPIIGYYPSEDYGFDLNHELFYYFQYVERVLKIKIMEGGPKSLVLLSN